MHEFSIVSSLMSLIEDYARRHNAKKVTKVVVGIGVLSGVEPDLLKIAFDTFKEKTICEEAQLVLEIEEVTLKCRDCGVQSQPEGKFSRKCPHCGSLNTEIISGQDLRLKSLELELED
jgi:hydrogenase nickel incorporation protein HypA/HybF